MQQLCKKNVPYRKMDYEHPDVKPQGGLPLAHTWAGRM